MKKQWELGKIFFIPLRIIFQAQKLVIPNTCSIVRKFLNDVEAENFYQIIVPHYRIYTFIAEVTSQRVPVQIEQ
jgi:hypothetical protein